jgi:hypothetical protein
MAPGDEQSGETEEQHLAELRHHTGWDSEMDALAVRAAGAGCLIAASDAAFAICFGAMESSSLSSATIPVSAFSERYQWLPEPSSTFLVALRREMRRRLGEWNPNP